jgi:hypothetical protein
VWASVAGLDSESYGKYFQWWNNFWFRYRDENGVNLPITTSTSKVDTTWYWPWNYYNSSTFITWLASFSNWSDPENNNLWWGITNTKAARQWPCESWYHIPSKNEWKEVIINGWWWSSWNDMSDVLKLPMAGFLTNNLSLTNGGSNGYYRTSDYVWRVWLAYSLQFYSDGAEGDYSSSWSRDALFIRCFKN